MNTNEIQKIVIETEAENHMRDLYSRIPQIIFDTYKRVYLRLEIKPEQTAEYCLYVHDKNYQFETYYSTTTEGCIAQCLEKLNESMEKRAKYYREQAEQALKTAAEYEAKIIG
jgi:hypothetical protein